MTTTKTKKHEKKKNKKGKKLHNGHLTAKRCDRFDLYEKSVQEPEAECDLIDQIWRERRDRRCESIREDFCGSAAVCMEWVKRRRAHTALGVDLDPDVLAWARSRIPQRLTPEQASRITLLQDDVMTVSTAPVDSVLAMNFSYYLFVTRDALRDYFRRARAALKDDGLFLLDAYGGSESFAELEEDRELEGFTYVWDQHSYDPITGRAVNLIHFRFPDGSELREAFRYDWRLWTLPEIREILLEAGFREVAVYWEGTDKKTGEGNGEWSVATEGEACEGWVAYLVAEK
jgi:SAM-dependent methyltransferase